MCLRTISTPETRVRSPLGLPVQHQWITSTWVAHFIFLLFIPNTIPNKASKNHCFSALLEPSPEIVDFAPYGLKLNTGRVSHAFPPLPLRAPHAAWRGFLLSPSIIPINDWQIRSFWLIWPILGQRILHISLVVKNKMQLLASETRAKIVDIIRTDRNVLSLSYC